MMNYVDDILAILSNNNLKKILSNQSDLEIKEKKGIGNIVTRIDKEIEIYISSNLKKCGNGLVINHYSCIVVHVNCELGEGGTLRQGDNWNEWSG